MHAKWKATFLQEKRSSRVVLVQHYRFKHNAAPYRTTKNDGPS